MLWGLSQILAVMVAAMYEAFLPMNKLGQCAYRQEDNTFQDPANPAEVNFGRATKAPVKDKTYGGAPTFTADTDNSKTYPLKLTEKVNELPWSDKRLLEVMKVDAIFAQRMSSFVRNMWVQGRARCFRLRLQAGGRSGQCPIRRHRGPRRGYDAVGQRPRVSNQSH